MPNLACSCLILVAALTMAFTAHTESRPNILFILTDDQGPWAMGNAGNPDADIPAMYRLARYGRLIKAQV